MKTLFFIGISILILAACHTEPEQLADFNGRWYRLADRQDYKQDTVLRARQGAQNIKIFHVWEDEGLFRYVYRNDTLIRRTTTQLYANYEFNFLSDTAGEMYVYNIKDTDGLDENTKWALASNYHFELNTNKGVITRKNALSGALDEMTYHWDGKNLILDGAPLQKAE
ncbi:MAG: hypothetical protein ACFB15_13180 [Cyclobacteriaceae bacterium]